MEIKHLSGLTDEQVIENRLKFGANVLTPPEKESLWDKLKTVVKHWILLSLIVITILSLGLAIGLYANGVMDTKVFVMPSMMLLATLLIGIVGFFGGLNDPLFKILITAFVLSIGIAIYEYLNGMASDTAFLEPIGIIVALLLATGVAFCLERSNEKTFQSLNDINDDTPVKVVRNSNVCQVPRRDVVVGDVLILETGEEVPADSELIEALNLTVNESSLTGEPQAHKTTDPAQFDPEATYPSNHILKGTIVIEGYCTARVLSVGDATACGKVFEAAQVNEGEPTPLSRKLDRLADIISKVSYAIAALIIVGRIIAYFAQGKADLDDVQGFIDFVTYILGTIMIAVTLIVVAVPEGLPMSVTLSLAFSMRKLMKENTLPRTMHSCETMGATSVICTDKTGTLTQNQMQVWQVKNLGTPNNLLAEQIAVNTTAELDLRNAAKPQAVGNPTEGALLLWLHAQNVDFHQIREALPIDKRLPFSTENKYMVTVTRSAALGGAPVLFVKGAPEIVMALCNISPDQRTECEQELAVFQSKAMRTLALAYMTIAEGTDTESLFANGRLTATGLHLSALFAISDPVRPEVPDAIKSCLSAGIGVKIVTGDTVGTAKEIGRQVGLWSNADTETNILTGAEFENMTDDELLRRIPDLKILSRARPNDKERLVRLLKQQGNVVAVTGDGTNDAPALNAADVGLSMGDGTAVAKEASDMTIMDNSFSTITNAVMWGRSLYKNIQRFILFQMTINVVACLIVLVGAFIGTQSPLTVTQMLWVNLIMDTFAAIALASLPPQPDVMKEKPRSINSSIVSRDMAKRILGIGGLFFVILLVILVFMQHSDVDSVTDILAWRWDEYNGLNEYEKSLFFTIFVMLQFWNMFNAKSFMTDKSASEGLKQSNGFITIAAVIFLGQIFIVTFLGKVFNVVPLRLSDWVLITVLTSFIFIVGEVYRFFRRRHRLSAEVAGK